MLEKSDDIEIVAREVDQLDVQDPRDRTSWSTWSSKENTQEFHKRRHRSRPVALGAPAPLKAWLEEPKTSADSFLRHLHYLTYVLFVLIIAAYCYSGYRRVDRSKYCLVLADDFDKLDLDIWTREQQLDGFNTGSFDWTTASSDNSFVKDGKLHIVPTLQTTVEQSQGNSVNLTETGECTGHGDHACYANVNSSVSAIINPVQSARLTSRGLASIKYGKVEVRAKMPKGLWLWPQISLLPVDLAYGQWPASGEIDIAQSWGNPATSGYGVSDRKVNSQVWYGPDGDYKHSKAISQIYTIQRGAFSDEYHTFGLIWNEKKIYTFVDQILTNVLAYDFKEEQQFWKEAHYKTCFVAEGLPCISNPWLNGTKSAPYDQPFYLSLGLRIGGLNGFFPDGDIKPWTDQMNHTTAMTNFIAGKSKWLPTWQDNSAFMIDSVRMWKKC